MKSKLLQPASRFIGHMKQVGAIASISALSLLLAACETTGSNVAGSGDAAPASRPQAAKAVTKGMTESEVLAILGEPREVEEVYQDQVAAQIWRYEREVVKNSTIESDGEQERVYADPETGQFITVREPIYRNEMVKAVIVAELLFVEGELIALKEKEIASDYEVGH